MRLLCAIAAVGIVNCFEIGGGRQVVMRRMTASVRQWTAEAREAADDALHTMRECVQYARGSASLSTECGQAWRRAWLAQGSLCVFALVLSSLRPPCYSYDLSMQMIRRWLGAIYAVGFSIALRTNGPLIGSRGLSPAWKLLRRYELALQRHNATSLRDKILALPTLLWLARTTNSSEAVHEVAEIDSWLNMLAGIGLACAAVAATSGGWLLSRGALTACYGCYLSIASVGHPFYAYGWESQLLETTFLAVFFGPIAMRWLCFKTMLGAGLIKERAKRRTTDAWRDLTAMTTFFETQPAPGPLSRRLHFLPRPVLLFATASNHVIELFAPWLLLLTPVFGRTPLLAYGLTHFAFQLTLCFSGNLSFLNYLTMAPALACFDDALWHAKHAAAPCFARGLELPGLMALAWLNVPVYNNLFAPSSQRKPAPPRQAMNAQFDRYLAGLNLRPFRLANAYGAFGSVSTTRDELVVQGSRGALDDWQWREYLFKASPALNDTRAPQIAPWHLRLDWQKWISACRGRDAANERWFLAFLVALLRNDPHVLRLLRHNPFSRTTPPAHVRVLVYRYKFAPLCSPELWTRELKTTLLRPVSLHELQAALTSID